MSQNCPDKEPKGFTQNLALINGHCERDLLFLCSEVEIEVFHGKITSAQPYYIIADHKRKIFHCLTKKSHPLLYDTILNLMTAHNSIYETLHNLLENVVGFSNIRNLSAQEVAQQLLEEPSE
jgi:hypothetical protein